MDQQVHKEWSRWILSAVILPNPNLPNFKWTPKPPSGVSSTLGGCYPPTFLLACTEGECIFGEAPVPTSISWRWRSGGRRTLSRLWLLELSSTPPPSTLSSTVLLTPPSAFPLHPPFFMMWNTDELLYQGSRWSISWNAVGSMVPRTLRVRILISIYLT